MLFLSFFVVVVFHLNYFLLEVNENTAFRITIFNQTYNTFSIQTWGLNEKYVYYLLKRYFQEILMVT